MLVSIFLPVSKPIKQFLTQKFGAEYQPSRDNWFGILISSLLSKKNSNWDDRGKNEVFEEEYKISFKLSYSDKHGICILPTHEQLLRRAVESLFREHLYETAVLNKLYYDIEYKTSIENLLNFYGIHEEEKSYYQTIIRDFNRKKDKIAQRLENQSNKIFS